MAPRLPEWRMDLRSWQRRDVEWWASTLPRDALIEACPGAGKTMFAAAVAFGALVDGLVDQVICVVPGDHLRSQWAESFARVGVQLDPTFASDMPHISRDVHGIAVTYAGVGMNPYVFARLMRRRTLVILDEVHHVGEGRQWAEAVVMAFDAATFRVSLTGTPFRTDGSPIPYVRYERGICVPDCSYTYLDGLRDKVVRPVVFYMQDGEAAWRSASGKDMTATFDAELPADQTSERLRAFLYDEAWLRAVLMRANTTLMDLRRRDHNTAGGIALAIDHAHARMLALAMERELGITPVVVVSADVAAASKIHRFAESKEPWLVAVRMVSEGTDIRRARVLAMLSTYTTELFFQQAVGRVVRATQEEPEGAYAFVPADPRLVAYASQMRSSVDHVIKESKVGQESFVERGERAESLFESVDAIHSEGAVIDDVVRHSPGGNGISTERPVIVAQEKEKLRRQIFGLVSKASSQFKVSHRAINATLKERDGVSSAFASHKQLEKRKGFLESMIGKDVYVGRRA